MYKSPSSLEKFKAWTKKPLSKKGARIAIGIALSPAIVTVAFANLTMNFELAFQGKMLGYGIAGALIPLMYLDHKIKVANIDRNKTPKAKEEKLALAKEFLESEFGDPNRSFLSYGLEAYNLDIIDDPTLQRLATEDFPYMDIDKLKGRFKQIVAEAELSKKVDMPSETKKPVDDNEQSISLVQ
jgi:hypothetical protein